MLRIGNQLQPFRDQPGGDRLQIEPLTAGNDRGQNLMHFRGGKDELHMLRRFLHGFQQHVPRRFAEHVNFVDDVDFVPAADRTGQRVVGQFPHVSGGVSAGGIHLHHIQTAFGGDFPATCAFAARLAVFRMLAIQRFGENPRQRGLADAPGPDKQVCVRGPPAADRIFQRPDHMPLPDHVGKSLRPPLPGDDLILAHGILSRTSRCMAKIRFSPDSARSSNSPIRDRENGFPSAVPCTSTSCPDSVITTFISTSAR